MTSTKRSWINRLLATAAMATVAVGLIGAAPAARADNDHGNWQYQNNWQGNNNWHGNNNWNYRSNYRYNGYYGRPYYYAPPPAYYYAPPPAYYYPPPAYVGPPVLSFGFSF